ncbi:transcription factor bHLH93-like isoform X2 [Senna tora]|uniref:Transcription factor bHLH93-like isoform X2 n=1 Tax=Senna tora TaxID=362788 RepID=A0A834SUN4_9FABA|nr:transcription factor bHLH93-like isoform X2 [Senna tora]
MELTQLSFLEELLASTRSGDTSSNNFPTSELLLPTTSSWSFFEFDSFYENPSFNSTFNPPFSAFPTPIIDHNTSSSFGCPYPYPFDDDSAPPPLQPQEDELDHLAFLGFQNQCLFEERIHDNNNNNSCKTEEEEEATQEQVPVFNMGLCCGDKRPKSKKLLQGQPSKNLMAERRRRKRLNDRLSMLRSIVPKISKMDRTAILGDTIDYMKELLEKIGKLQEEDADNHHIKLLGVSKEVKPNQVMFDVERREQDTRINICCAAKPGLLLSTVNSLEALGLEIQQCVISSFNDFSVQASCSEVGEQRTRISSEEIKEALFRNAGYGGRCL